MNHGRAYMTEQSRAKKPLASLSCDLDDRWAYMKTRGNPAWEQLPSYLEIVVPRLLGCLKRHRVQATVFVVGQDAAIDRNRELFRTIAGAGHEIGNHSFRHDPWLHQYSQEDTAGELAMAEEHIERATGHRPVGFRGPGYSLSKTIIAELVRRGYLYDASTLPTFIGPLVRAYFLKSSRLTHEQVQKRKTMFGRWRDGFRKIRPYKWNIDGKSLIEIPVTTMPFSRLPIHVSYLLSLSRCSPLVARRYFVASLALCRETGIQPSILLHPLDFLGCDEAEGVEFFPGMNLPTGVKLELVDYFMEKLCEFFRVVTVREHAIRANQEAVLSVMKPAF